jgi:hypothetical protein
MSGVQRPAIIPGRTTPAGQELCTYRRFLLEMSNNEPQV